MDLDRAADRSTVACGDGDGGLMARPGVGVTEHVTGQCSQCRASGNDLTLFRRELWCPACLVPDNIEAPSVWRTGALGYASEVCDPVEDARGIRRAVQRYRRRTGRPSENFNPNYDWKKNDTNE